MKKFILGLMVLLITSNAYATLTVGNVPRTKTGGSTPKLEDSPISSVGSNVGVGTTNPIQKLDLNGNLNFSSVVAPPAPTLALTAGGSVTAGNHYYKITYTTADGKETETSPISSVITTSAGNLSVIVTFAVSTDSRVTGRNIYRTKVGNPTSIYLVTSIADNTTTQYTDTLADGSLGATDFVERENTTGGQIFIQGNNAGFIGMAWNTAWGRNTLTNNTAGKSNTAIGTDAMASNTTGSFSTGIGVHSIQNTTTGSRNTALGYTSLTENITGSDNTAIGQSALGANLSGIASTAVGSSALFNTGNVGVGSYNTAVGYQATYTNSTGQKNTSVGVNSLYTYNGDNNTAVGYYALQANASGDQSTAVGANALASSTGAYNAALGARAGYSAVAGDFNVWIGKDAGNLQTGGGNNVVIGGQAGYGLAATAYSDNTLLGYRAGYGIASGTKNTYIGREAGNVGIGTSNVFVGYRSGYYESGSNKLMIDNVNRTDEATHRAGALIYGTFNATPANQTLTLNANVGIGSVAPVAKLDISGTASKIRMQSADGTFWNCQPANSTGVFTCS